MTPLKHCAFEIAYMYADGRTDYAVKVAEVKAPRPAWGVWIKFSDQRRGRRIATIIDPGNRAEWLKLIAADAIKAAKAPLHNTCNPPYKT